MNFILSLLTSRLAGPAASIAAVILLALCVGQCTRAAKAEHRATKAEKSLVAAQRDLGTCRANVQTLDDARKAQNAALAARSDEDARSLAEATKRLSEAAQGRAKAEARAAALLKAGPVGIDACARAMDAFETVKEQAR